MGVFDIDKINKEVLERDGWWYSGADNSYIKCIYNRTSRGHMYKDGHPDALSAIIDINNDEYTFHWGTFYIGCEPVVSVKGIRFRDMAELHMLVKDLVRRAMELPIPTIFFNETLLGK